MKYRNVGRSGIKVSEIALGSWMTQLEDRAATDNAAAIVHSAFDSGVNFFDCADARGATTGFVVADAVGGPGLIRWAKPDSWEDAGGPGQVTTMGCEEVR